MRMIFIHTVKSETIQKLTPPIKEIAQNRWEHFFVEIVWTEDQRKKRTFPSMARASVFDSRVDSFPTKRREEKDSNGAMRDKQCKFVMVGSR
ncbi:hypothetical protein K0M31_000256 [Melipona bicolor]|uniref:Uncharacterized protein n=1 Tax=Melipona bicolor TaxID=60889 RepID=A0AA40GEG3_9HYME|nr:hypothetical protein K0M31_000256 [Melipona bicolor]